MVRIQGIIDCEYIVVYIKANNNPSIVPHIPCVVCDFYK
jgi:hypothetical protein